MRFSITPRTALHASLALAAACGAAACGGRTGLTSPPPLPPGPACAVDADCPGYGDLCKSPITCEHVPSAGPGSPLVARCVAGTPVDCDDHDPCTKDTCIPATGACTYSHATPDQDGDGYYAPLPGYEPGSPGACGDDCDDTNPDAHPGANEVCDGVDNDCDGIIDNGAVYLPSGADPIRISGDIAPAGPGGLAWSGKSYAATYTGDTNGFNVYLSTLTGAGDTIKPPGEEVVTLVNADASGAPITWIGDRYGTVWQDRRTGHYEIYFTILDAGGAKKIADTQLTFNGGFSVNPDLIWNGVEFVAAWQDDRNGTFDVYVQRVSAEGAVEGGNIQLTHGDMTFGNEAPSLAQGLKGVGVASSFGDATSHMVQLQIFTTDFATPMTPPINVTDGTTEAVYPTVVWNKDRYVVAWYDKSASPKAIWAAAYGADGLALIPPQPITQPGPFRSRYPFLRALGDRILVVYSDDRDQNDGYEIYTTVIRPDLTLLGAELRVTDAPRDSVFPLAAFGPKGDFGILFRDDREAGQQNVFFTPLACHL